MISQVLRESQSLVIPVVTPEARGAFAVPGAAELARLLNIRSAMAVPLQFRGKRTGAMSFLSDHRTYGQDDLRFAEAYARQVSGILENTRLYQQAEEAIRVRDEFVSLASHELRTPLTALRTSAEGNPPAGGQGRRRGRGVRPPARDAKDPDTAYPPIEPLLPPEGAPNVLIVLLDDVGFGASSAFGGPCRDAERRAARGGRAEVQPVPHDRAVRADPCRRC